MNDRDIIQNMISKGEIVIILSSTLVSLVRHKSTPTEGDTHYPMSNIRVDTIGLTVVESLMHTIRVIESGCRGIRPGYLPGTSQGQGKQPLILMEDRGIHSWANSRWIRGSSPNPWSY